MSAERTQILQMLADGKVSVEEAERLLEAIGQDKAGDGTDDSAPECCEGKANPKYLCVKVEPKEGQAGERVNVRIPLMLVKAGVKLGGVLPESAQGKITGAFGKKGIEIDAKKLAGGDFDAMIQMLTETSIDVDDETETVKVYCC